MTTTLIITYWRDIPSQVEARKSRREREKVMLSDRFMIAIDKAAMRAKLHESDGYLAQWRKSSPSPSPHTHLAHAVQEQAQALENLYTDEKLQLLVNNGGYES